MMQGQNFVWIVALPVFLWKNMILAYFAILCWKIFRNSKFFFSIKSTFSSLQHTLRRLSKVENCVLVARKAKTPKNGANFVKKIFLPETQLQVISKQNPYTPDPLGGRGSWWTPPHISTPRTQFSYLVSFLPTCVLRFGNRRKVAWIPIKPVRRDTWPLALH